MTTFFPGQIATIFLETTDSDGYHVDSLTTPIVTRIFGFNSTDGYTLYDGYFGHDGYQKPMISIDTGIYYAKFTLPKNAASIGSYLIDVNYTDPVTTFPRSKLYTLFINSAFGGFGATTI